MNLIIKDRQKGKTTQLIYISEATRYPIVVSFEAQKKHIIELAIQMGCLISRPLTIHQLKERGFDAKTPILFDDVEHILADALQQYLGVEVFCATTTDTLKEYYTNCGVDTRE